MASNIVRLVNARKLTFDDGVDLKSKNRLQGHLTLIDRLGYSNELEGHRGCVNCLQWNGDGSLLASGSDDLDIHIWNVFEKKCVASVKSGHTGNIFSVKFLPFSGDLSVVSGAEDREVRLHDLTTFSTTQVWSCCSGRVKRLAVSNHSPYLVWSASEDGCVRQHDIRESHSCKGDGRCRNVLIDLKGTCGPNSNCKCIDVNPIRHEQIAVGAFDPYVRLYDTRILSLSYPTSELTDRPETGCIAHFAPGHISQSFRKVKSHSSNTASTYVTFSPCGNELLTNLSSEQIYLYDTVNLQPVLTYTQHNSDPLLFHKPSSCPVMSRNVPSEDSIPATVIALRDKGNDYYKDSEYTGAIQCYSSAIQLYPMWHVLYSNRATAHMKRNWYGDTYNALLDTERVLHINPVHQKSLQRRIKCLKCLGWIKEALWYANKYSQLSPDDEEYNTKTTKELEKLEDEREKNGYHKERKAVSSWEQNHQQNAFDYCGRFVGHCNTHTDIKEASFLGRDGEYIGAGSDDGNVFVWEKKTGNLVKILAADESIVNCVQWNPTTCILATSGIEPVVKLWEPCPLNRDHESKRTVSDMYKVCDTNQKRMRLDPFEIMLMRMGLRMASEDMETHDQESVMVGPQQCRPS